MNQANDIRDAMRSELKAAMKASRPDAVAALRAGIAAIDNAEAVPADQDAGALQHASAGVGSADVPRRELSRADVQAILRRLVDDYLAEADRYQALNQQDAAQRLRREADALVGYTDRV